MSTTPHKSLSEILAELQSHPQFAKISSQLPADLNKAAARRGLTKAERRKIARQRISSLHYKHRCDQQINQQPWPEPNTITTTCHRCPANQLFLVWSLRLSWLQYSSSPVTLKTELCLSSTSSSSHYSPSLCGVAWRSSPATPGWSVTTKSLINNSLNLFDMAIPFAILVVAFAVVLFFLACLFYAADLQKNEDDPVSDRSSYSKHRSNRKNTGLVSTRPF